MKKLTEYIIGIGTNLGDKKSNIELSLEHIASYPIEIIKIASLYSTAPIGPANKTFLNCAIKIETIQNPVLLLSQIKEIEQQMGRKETIRWGDRIIDLDILLENSSEKVSLTTPNLNVPHKELLNRDFALAPTNEIAPNWIHPITLNSIALEWQKKMQEDEMTKTILNQKPWS